MLRIPHCLDNRLTVGGEISLTRLSRFTPQKIFWYWFLLEAQLTSKPWCIWKKVTFWLIKHYVMKAYGGVYVWIHVFLTSVLVADESLASSPCCFTPGERTPVPMDRRLSGPQSRSGRCGEVTILDPTGTRISTLVLWILQPVVILTTLLEGLGKLGKNYWPNWESNPGPFD
jgi:hypothetical protein